MYVFICVDQRPALGVYLIYFVYFYVFTYLFTIQPLHLSQFHNSASYSSSPLLPRECSQTTRPPPPWILKSGYPKLSSCRACTVGEIRRVLKMVPTCTDCRDVPWGQ